MTTQGTTPNQKSKIIISPLLLAKEIKEQEIQQSSKKRPR